MVLLILAGIWAAVLIPPILRARAESSPADSIVDFRRQLRVLQRARPLGEPGVPLAEPVAAQSVGPRPRASAAMRQPVSRYGPTRAGRPGAPRVSTARRRRDVMFALLMAVGTTFVLATVLSVTALWVVHLVADGLLVGYVALLVRMRNLAAEREMKLRFLPPPPRPQPQPALLLRRSAN